MIGKLLRGHYRIERVLSKGGWGETYVAVDIDRPGHPFCVVKRLKPASHDPKFLQTARHLFRQEAETLERLGKHDQIPRLLAYFEEDQEFYLVQDLIEGQPLSVELPPGHRWSETKVIQLLQDVLSILEFVHQEKVIHRDLKPRNLIRRQQDGKLVLIDFGAVKKIRDPLHDPVKPTQSPLNPTTISIGTQGYMPPEQVRGKPRYSSDIYALGMIGIQALTGIDPAELQEDSRGDVIWQHYRPVGEQLAAILTKMVRYHFGDRYESTTEVLQALQPLLEPKAVEPVTTPEADLPEFVPPDLDPEAKETKVVPNFSPLTPTTSELGQSEAGVLSGAQQGLKAEQIALKPDGELNETRVVSNPTQQADLKETKVVLETHSKEQLVDAISVNQAELNETKISLNASARPGEPTRPDLQETRVVAFPPPLSDSAHQATVSQAETKVSGSVQRETKISPVAYPMAGAASGRNVRLMVASISIVLIGAAIASASWLFWQSLQFSKNYGQLQQLLQQQRWEAADQATYELMLQIAGSKSEAKGYFDMDEWQKFPCRRFNQVDQLWREASNGRLGFSAQWQVYQSQQDSAAYFDAIGWSPLNEETWLVAWEYDETTKRIEYSPDQAPNFDNPPPGHLPAKLEWEDSRDHRLEKVKSCQ